MQLTRKIEHLVPTDFDKLAQGFGEHDDLRFIIIEFQTLNQIRSQQYVYKSIVILRTSMVTFFIHISDENR
jgi:hypothetical protein